MTIAIATAKTVPAATELHRAPAVARALGICVPTLRAWVNLGQFPAPIRVRNRSYWTDQQLQEFLGRGQ